VLSSVSEDACWRDRWGFITLSVSFLIKRPPVLGHQRRKHGRWHSCSAEALLLWGPWLFLGLDNFGRMTSGLTMLLSVWTGTCCGRCPHDGHSRIPSMLPRGKEPFPGCLLSAGKPTDHLCWWCGNILLLSLKLFSIKEEGAQLGLSLLLRCCLGNTGIWQFL
jgi:hypothetical protein